MDKKYSKKGMVLIGAEVQGSAEDKINEIIDEHKVQFTVTKGIIGPNLSNSIPHMAVFAANGDLLFNGHPNNAEKVIKTALKDVKEEPPTTESSLFAKPKYLINERIWTNTEGKTLKAALISMEGQVGKFRFSNGRTFNYDVTKLSADDQSLIKEKSGKESEDEGTEELDDRFQF